MQLTLPSFKAGYSYNIIFQSEEKRRACLQQLSTLNHVGVVAYDGGLLGNLNVWENLVLPVTYHQLLDSACLESRIMQLLYPCTDLNSSQQLLQRWPDELSLYERRLIGFVRAMLLAPEWLVYDRLYEGLAVSDAQRASQFNHLFRRYFPFRISILLEFNEYVKNDDDHQQILYM